MISKNLKFFNVDLPNLSYKSHGYAQELFQSTLTNLVYLWDVQRKAYYFLASKNTRRIYNFNDPAAFEDEGEEECAHMEDEHHIGDHQNLHEEDVMMHNASIGYLHGAGSSSNYDDTSTILLCFKTCRYNKMNAMLASVKGELHLSLHK